MLTKDEILLRLRQIRLALIIKLITIHYLAVIFFTGSENGIIKVWNLELKEVKDSFSKHTESITCVQISYDCSFLISGSRDKTLCVWDITLAVVITCFQVRLFYSFQNCLFMCQNVLSTLML